MTRAAKYSMAATLFPRYVRASFFGPWWSCEGWFVRAHFGSTAVATLPIARLHISGMEVRGLHFRQFERA
jgi:hypothetical protein